MKVPDGTYTVPVVHYRTKEPTSTVRYYFEGSNEFWGASCRECGIATSAEELVKDKTKKHGRGLICYPCNYSRVLRRKELHRDKILEEKRRYHLKHGKRDQQRKIQKRSGRTPEEILADRRRLRPSGYKTCGGCRQTLPLTSYYNNIITADGLDRMCTTCNRERTERWRVSRAPKHWKSLGIPLECVYCSGEYEHADHLVSLFDGGPDTLSNMAPACARCNLTKNNRTIQSWYPDHAERNNIAQTLDGLLDKLRKFGYEI